MYLDCSQCPIFPWDFRDSYASVEPPPSWFVKANVTWGEYLNYQGEGGGISQGTFSRGGGASGWVIGMMFMGSCEQLL